MGAGGFVNQAFQNMVNWQWYYDQPVRILFYHLLTIINIDDKMECGICVKAGNVLTTIAKLEKETLLTSKQIRIALSKLSSTHEISVIPSRKNGTIISITEWFKYKSDDAYQQNDDNASNIGMGKQRANKGQTEQSNLQQLTNHNKTDKANKGQTEAMQEPQNEHKGKQRANKGQTEAIENHDDVNATLSEGANKGQTESNTKESENEDIPPIPPIEVKDQETYIKEENIKEESSSEMFSNQASPQQMIMPGFNDFSMKSPRERIAVKNKKLVGIIDEDKKKWKHDFPYLDIDALLEDAEIYLGKHPKKYTDVFGFLNNMFKRQPYPFPKTSDDVLLIAKERNLNLTREAAEYFFNKYQSIGWHDNNNKPIHDWRCLLENFVATWNQNHYGPQTGNAPQPTQDNQSWRDGLSMLR